MSKKDMVHIVGAALTRAREAQGLSQRALSAAYASARALLPGSVTVAPRTFASADLSRLEKTYPGQVVGKKGLVPSRQKRAAALLLANLLKVDIDELILEIAPESLIFASENYSLLKSPPPLILLGAEADLPAVELAFIPGPYRAAFFGLEGATYMPTETRRQYLRGAPSHMYTGRVVFAVAGDSMEPYLTDGDEVIAVEVPPAEWSALRNRVVVVACARRVAIEKIIENDLDAGQRLTLLPYRDVLAPRTLGRADIRAIWLVETHLPKAVPVRL